MKIKNYLLSLSALAILALTLSGCAYFETYLVSVPTANTKATKWQNEEKEVWSAKIESPSFDLHLRPLNDIKTSEWAAFIIIPVYISTRDKEALAYFRDREPYNRDAEFRILIAILPKESDLSLNTDAITLSVDGITHTPSGIEGPVQYDPSVQPAMFYTHPSLAEQLANVHKGYVFSITEDKSQKRIVGAKTMKVSVPKTGLWSCYELIFDCKTPSPEQEICLDVGGLSQRDRIINVPGIKFEKSIRSVAQSIP